ncbi:hypothetical protein M8332_05740 [Fructilactobacillus ixorae]|uniref:Glycosyl-4,4'-diaponeurosporenoate acyltransferase n=1 Tax=Fructilactobacillus ixorae TaxID=1750535 RepID=A0ABY5C4J4_9LACO|nr:hypothetical protein [Fructilactobacillus ixorae]USS93098.1 hypothetical protein M8332_05740 [Fructilactobacillus ixorae]
MEVVIGILGFIGDWLLFIFPLYQGQMELMESNSVFAKYQIKGHKPKNASLLEWMIPPLLFRRIKRTAGKAQINDLINNKEDFQNFYSFYNKGLAWYFVSYAGFLNGVCSTYELIIEKLALGRIGIVIFIVVSLLIFFAGHYFVSYLTSGKREKRFIKRMLPIVKNTIKNKQ